MQSKTVFFQSALPIEFKVLRLCLLLCVIIEVCCYVFYGSLFTIPTIIRKRRGTRQDYFENFATYPHLSCAPLLQSIDINTLIGSISAKEKHSCYIVYTTISPAEPQSELSGFENIGSAAQAGFTYQALV